MSLRLRFAAAMVMAVAAMPQGWAYDWATVATVSDTVGINSGHLCVGLTRGDIGCAANAPSVNANGDLTVYGNLNVSGSQMFQGVTFANGGVSATGTITATTFYGDGAGITGIDFSLNPLDRIVSGTTSFIAYNALGVLQGTVDHAGGAMGITNLDNTGYSNLVFYNTSRTNKGYIGYANPGASRFADSVYMGSSDATSLNLVTSATTRLTIDSNGNVGIGTDTPSDALHFHAHGVQRFILTRDSYPTRFQMRVSNNGTEDALLIGPATKDSTFTITSNSTIGLGTTRPSTTLDVMGTLKLANGGESCDTSRLGAIRYTSGAFSICQDVSHGWEALATTGENSLADRITSGTTQVITNGPGNSISFTVGGVTTGYFYNGMLVANGVSTTGTVSGSNGYFTNRVGIGTKTPQGGLLHIDGAGSSNAAINLSVAGSSTSGMDVISFVTSAPTIPTLGQADSKGWSLTGRGNSFTTADEQNDLNLFRHNGNTATRILNFDSVTGNIGIKTETPATPQAALDISGTLKIANGGEACDAARLGAVKYQSNAFYICQNTTDGWQPLATSGGTSGMPDRIVSGSAVATIDPSGTVKIRGLLDIDTGSNVVGVGLSAALGNTNVRVTAVGYAAGMTNTGIGLTALGASAGSLNTGANVTALGYNTGASNTGANATIVGRGAGYQNAFDNVTILGANAIADKANQVVLGDVGVVEVSTSGVYVGKGISTTGGAFISGTLKIANGGETCDTDRIGAIKYDTGAFYICQNTSNGWEALATTGANSLADRITSGTTQVITNGPGNSISFTVGGVTTGYFYNGMLVASGVSTTGAVSASNLYSSGNVGVNNTNPAYPLDIVGSSWLAHMGNTASTGLYFSSNQIMTSNTLLFINNNSGGNVILASGGGRVAVGSAFRSSGGAPYPSTTLDIDGSIRLSSETNAALDVCDTDRIGAIKYDAGAFYICQNTSNGWEALATTGANSLADRITSGTTQVITNGAGRSISFTVNGTTTGYFYNGMLVASGVSTTGTISGSSGYFAGNVGIGTPTPDTALVVSQTIFGSVNGAANFIAYNNTYPADNGGHGIIYVTNGDDASDAYGGIVFRANDDLGTGRHGAAIMMGKEGLWQDTPPFGSYPGYLSFWTRKGGAGGGEAERMRITSTGNVGIGTTSPTSALTVSGSIGVVSNGAIAVMNDYARPAMAFTASDGTYYPNVAERWEIYPHGIGSSPTSTASRFDINTRSTSSTITRLSLSSNGAVMLGTSSGGDACDTSHLGGIKYQGSAFYVCQNTTDGWELLATNSASNANDRITSGTTSVIATQNQSVTINTAGSTAMTIGANGNIGIGTTSPSATLDVNGTISTTLLVWGPKTDKALLTYYPPGDYAVLSNASTTWENSLRIGNGSFSVYVSNTATSATVAIVAKGNGVGINGKGSPDAALDVSGTLKIANGGEACDTSRLGAIKYQSNAFYICQDTSHGWEPLATTGAYSASDRITSGTTNVITNGAGNSISFTVGGVTTGYFYNGMLVASGVSTTGAVSGSSGYFAGKVGIGTTQPDAPLSVVGSGGTLFTISATTGGAGMRIKAVSPGFSYLDFYQGGINIGNIRSDPAGYFVINAQATNTILNPAGGNVGIRTATPTTALDISGSLKISNGGETCTTGRYGTMRIINGVLSICRQ